MIELAILGLLSDQELHGYELKKRLAELPGLRASVSFGSLYPALNRLERGGHVKAVEANTQPDRPVPSSGSLKGELAAFRARHPLATGAGRSRKVYGITPGGAERLTELLLDGGPDDDRTFALKVAFCRHLDPAARLDLFRRRRSDVAGRLADLTRPKGRDRLLDRYVRTLRDRDELTLTTDLAWLDRLIADEQAAPTEETPS